MYDFIVITFHLSYFHPFSPIFLVWFDNIGTNSQSLLSVEFKINDVYFQCMIKGVFLFFICMLFLSFALSKESYGH